MHRRAMRIVFFLIGVLALAGGVGLLIATALANFPALTGYSAGAAVSVGGVVVLLAAMKRYRGHWSFITGVGLSTLALAGFGADIDGYVSGGKTEDFFFGAFLAIIFLTFGSLS